MSRNPNPFRRVGVTVLAATLVACMGDDSRLTGPFTPTEPTGFRQIAAVSGTSQVGKAGDILPEPLVVRVSDAAGAGIPNVRVTWKVSSGKGWLYEIVAGELQSRDFNQDNGLLYARTDANGISQATLYATALGVATVTAAVVNASEAATFMADARIFVISNAYWGYFAGPDYSDEPVVPVGTTVEWLNYYGSVEIKSVSVPEGGTAFSARLATLDRFQLVPAVAGTWEWTYTYFGPSGEVLEPAGHSKLIVQTDPKTGARPISR